MTDADSDRALCIVHGCGQPAEVEFTWSGNTCLRLGWPDDTPRTRVYCRPCFGSKLSRHPWDQADEIRAMADVSR